MTWSTRTFTNQILITLGMLQAAQVQERFSATHFDIGELPIPAGKLKASSVPRDPAEIDMIVVHVTAVRGGFGASKAAVKRWHDYIAEDHALLRLRSLWVQLRDAGVFDDPHYTGPLASRLALWERYRSTPYHEIASQTGDCVANRDLAQRSYHAGLGNDGAGLAIDCGHDEELSESLILTGRHALRMLDARLRMHGDPSRVIRVAPHRAFDASRRLDTNHRVWREIVKPVVVAKPELEIDYRLKMGKGRPVPRSWDEDALFDDKGKLAA